MERFSSKTWPDFQGGHRLRLRGESACVRGERVDLELSVGSWRQSTRSAGNSLPQFDNGLQRDASKRALES
jgi:hypothetical protein